MGFVIATVILLAVGAVMGLIAYAVMPGRNVPVWAAVLVGMIAMPLGSLLARLFGVGDTEGVDWIELLLQFVIAVLGPGVIAGARSRRGTA